MTGKERKSALQNLHKWHSVEGIEILPQHFVNGELIIQQQGVWILLTWVPPHPSPCILPISAREEEYTLPTMEKARKHCTVDAETEQRKMHRKADVVGNVVK